MDDLSDLGGVPVSDAQAKAYIAQRQNDLSDIGGIPISDAQAKAYMAANNPSAMDKVNKALTTFNSAIEDTGLPNAARAFFQGGANTTANMLNFVSDLTGNRAPQFPQSDFGAVYSPTGDNALTANLKGALAMGSNIAGAGTALGGPLGMGTALAGESLPMVSSIGNSLQNAYQQIPLLSQALSKVKSAVGAIPGASAAGSVLSSPITQGAIGNAFLGASQFPDNRLLGGILGGGASAAIQGAPVAAQNAITALARPRATQADVNNVLSALPPELQNTVPIGELIKSSPVAGLQQNVLSNIPFSGMNKPYEALNTYVKNEGQDIVGNLVSGSSTGNIQRDVYNSIKGNYDGLVNQTNQAYQDFRDAAQASNAPLNLQPLSDSIDSKISSITSDLQRNPRRADQYQPILDALTDYKNTIPSINNFDDLERLRVDMNKDAETAFGGQNFEFSRQLKSLKGSLDDSMDASVEDNSQLQDMLTNARNLYKQQIPFREAVNQKGNEVKTTFFNNYLAEKGGASPNLDNFINENIKTGVNKDATDTLNNLMRLIPDQQTKNLVAAHYLGNVTDDNGAVNPGRLMNAYGKLGSGQKSILFPDVKDRLDKLQTISKTYPDLFKIDFNPRTGQQTAKMLGAAAEGVGLGAGTSQFLGGNYLAGLQTLAGIPVAGYLGRRLTTSPAMRNALMNQGPLVNPAITNALNKLYLSNLASGATL